MPVALFVVGMARTNAGGELEFEGEGAFAPGTFDTGTQWRIDQQVRKLGKLPTNQGNCVECILVCAPTTRVVLNDDGDGLFPFVP